MEKVAIINSVLDFVSTGQLARSLYEYALSQGYEAFVFFGRGEKRNDRHLIRIEGKPTVYTHKLLTLLTGFQGFFSTAATKRLIRTLEREDIRKVVLLNLHGYYLNEKLLLNYLRDKRIVTAYVTPDEYPGLGKCCYSEECEKYQSACFDCPHVRDYPKSLFFDRSREIFAMKKAAYEGFDTLTLLGPEANLVKFRRSALLRGKPLRRANWGIDLSFYRYEADGSLYEKYGIPRDKILVMTAAKYSEPRKGVKQYFVEAARRFVDTDYHFIHVGFDGDRNSEVFPENMTVIDFITDQREMTRLYSLADLFVLASVSDTMPLSCLTAFACETPVCCFYTSGLRYLAPRESRVISYCDEISVDALCAAIRSRGKKDAETRAACRALAEEEYSEEGFCRKVFEVVSGEWKEEKET